MDPGNLEREVLSQIEKSPSLYFKEKTTAGFMAKMESRKRIAEMSVNLADTTIKMNSRLMGVSTLRNNCYHTLVDSYLKVLSDKDQDLKLRIRLAEALGWFTLSYRKGDIIATCRTIAASGGTDQDLKNELLKTVNRLEVYMR